MQQNPMIYQLYAVTAPAADLAEQVKRAIAGGITMLLLQPGPHRFGYNSSVFLPLSISSYQSQTTNYTSPSSANAPDTKTPVLHRIYGTSAPASARRGFL